MEALGAAGRERALSEFTPERCVEGRRSSTLGRSSLPCVVRATTPLHALPAPRESEGSEQGEDEVHGARYRAVPAKTIAASVL